MFTIFANSPYDTLSITEDNAKELCNFLDKVSQRLQELETDIDNYEMIEELDRIVDKIQEYVKID